jgi:hypothetical protein
MLLNVSVSFSDSEPCSSFAEMDRWLLTDSSKVKLEWKLFGLLLLLLSQVSPLPSRMETYLLELIFFNAYPMTNRLDRDCDDGVVLDFDLVGRARVVSDKTTSISSSCLVLTTIFSSLMVSSNVHPSEEDDLVELFLALLFLTLLLLLAASAEMFVDFVLVFSPYGEKDTHSDDSVAVFLGE